MNTLIGIITVAQNNTYFTVYFLFNLYRSKHKINCWPFMIYNSPYLAQLL